MTWEKFCRLNRLCLHWWTLKWEWAPRAMVVMFLISQNSEHTWWPECSLGFYGKNPNGQLLSLHHHCAVQKQPMPQKEMESDRRAMFFLVCICRCLLPPTLSLSVLSKWFEILVIKMRDSQGKKWFAAMVISEFLWGKILLDVQSVLHCMINLVFCDWAEMFQMDAWEAEPQGPQT
jgi:hypothetical protein